MTIFALRKPLTIPGALKVLLLSLAVSDLGVGLPVQPLENDKSCLADKRKHSNSNFWDLLFMNFRKLSESRKLSYGHKYSDNNVLSQFFSA